MKLCSFSTAELSNLLCEEELCGPMWPFAYEVGVRKWLNSSTKFIENNPGYSYLRTNRVRFYEPFSTPSGKAKRTKKNSPSKPSSNLRQLLLHGFVDGYLVKPQAVKK